MGFAYDHNVGIWVQARSAVEKRASWRGGGAKGLRMKGHEKLKVCWKERFGVDRRASRTRVILWHINIPRSPLYQAYEI